MKKLLIVILCFAFLLPHSCNAEGNSNPLGLYTMTGEFLGIGMERTAIEEILGTPLNNPFPAPSPSTLSFVDFVMYIWRDSPLLDNHFDGYYCAYPGNIIIQYNFPFEWEEFASEPVYQRYL